ncbi:MAG: SMC-Scp complex subunit ScpB [Candidatus Bathyarchaeota archaeon]|nr:SMC-Scp complex subunit ScpB [Candidatus Bathyarchaeota archaeon]
MEAFLYAAGRPIGLTTIVTQLRLDNEREATTLVNQLVEAYEADATALEVKKLTQDKVVLQLKSDFIKPARKVSIKPLLSAGPLRTLSYVAYYQPVEQKEVAQARGSQAYKHLRQLEEMGLIKREKEGRTSIVRTTPDFADNLGISHDRTSMRRQLRGIFRKLELDQMEKK